MSRISIYDQSLELQGVIDDVISARKTERINSDYTLDFSTFLNSGIVGLIAGGNVAGVDSDYFDIVYYKKSQSQDGRLYVNVECEHISYRLNDPEYDLEYFTQTGTPTTVLAQILNGTGFTAGTVNFADQVTYSAQEKKSRRQLLMEFVTYLGGEVEFDQFAVSILSARGSDIPKSLTAGRNISVIEKTYNRREKDQSGNPLVSYTCRLIKPVEIALGDAVTLAYQKLDIDIALRVVSISVNPYNSREVDFEIGNFIPGIADEAYRIETTTLAKGKTYYGARIGPENGFESIRSDKMARGVFNADKFALQRGDGSGGNWVDEVYFDPAAGRYKFNGILESPVVVTQILSANLGNIAELTVDRLETSDKVQKYLASDTSDVNYIRIYDQHLEFVTASTTGEESVQLTDRDGEPLYWTDGTHSATTYTSTDHPVMIYVYSELIKLDILFEEIDGVMIPRIILGAGSGSPENPDREKGFIYKDPDGMLLKYVKSDDDDVYIRLGENGIEGMDTWGLFGIYSSVNQTEKTITTSETSMYSVSFELSKQSRLLIHFACKVTTAGAVKVSAKAYVNGRPITMVPEHYCTAAGSYMFSFQMLSELIKTGNTTVDIRMFVDSGTATIGALQGELVVEPVYYSGTPTDYDTEIALSAATPVPSTAVNVSAVSGEAQSISRVNAVPVPVQNTPALETDI